MIAVFSLLSNCWEFSTRHPGILLVLLGVAGEVIFDWKEMKGRLAWAKRLSALVLIAGLILEFSEAAKSDKDVSVAIVRAGNAEKEAGQANERAAKFDADRVMLEKQAEQIRSTNLVLQTKLLELDARTHDRTISPETRRMMLQALADAQIHKGSVTVAAFQSDREAVTFGKKITDLLNEAGCNATFNATVTMNATYTGLVFLVKDPSKRPPFADVILSVFKSNSIEAGGWLFMNDYADDQVGIYVFPKPALPYER
jgi:hypothetical protein